MIVGGQPGHIDQIKQVNAGAVYRLIDLHGPISRIELSKRAQLAPASITKIVRELVEAHLVQETEFEETSNRGRPAIGLILDTEAWHYLAIRMNPGSLTIALRDLSSKIVVEEQLSLPAIHELPLLERLLSEINQFFTRHQAKLERLTAIAVTLPGIIDAVKGIVHRMPFYDDEELPLSDAIANLTGLPVFLQHDISAWTMAEALFGASKGSKNVIQVVIDHNVGAGVITNSKILHAGTSSVIEIGHTQVEAYGKRCYCGNHGCLETVASIESILELTQDRLNHSPNSLLLGQELSIDTLCAAALQGDLLAKDVIMTVGHNVGRIVAMMVNIFNPEKILVGSPLNQAAEILYPAILACIKQQSIPTYTEHLQINSTQFHNSGTMPGAALVKDALYNGSLLVKLLQG